MTQISESPTDLPSRLADARETFRQQFETEPRWAACAPGRVNIIGEHVDYNEGFVLPMAIGRQTVIVAGPPTPVGGRRRVSELRVYSKNLDDLQILGLPARDAPRQSGWSAYLQGVSAGFEERGLSPGALNVVVDSNVPLGGGLSSSASLEVAFATLIESVTGTGLDPLDKVRLCQTAEHEYAGVPCGIMDQFVVTMAQDNRLVLLDCRSLQAEMIPFDPPAPALLVVNTNVRHELGETQYAARRHQCEVAARSLKVASLRDLSYDELMSRRSTLDPTVFRRARHVVTEIQRTRQAALAIRNRDWRQAGELMDASHASLRDDYAVSCDELDCLVRLSQQLGTASGVYGTRMTGGGFGGCTVSLVDPQAIDGVAETIATRYRRQTGIEPSWFVTSPGAGACALPLAVKDSERVM